MSEVVPHTDEQALQQFLSDSPWDYRAVMDQVAHDTNALLGGPGTALLLDETSVVKTGKQSVGVARQWCGQLGKVDSCQVGVFAALAKGNDVCLIAGELYLSQEWIEGTGRCEKARVPKNKQALRSKVDIALELIKRARENGLSYG